MNFQELKASKKGVSDERRKLLNSRVRAWRLKNPEHARELGRLERLRNKAKRKRYADEYEKNNKDKIKARNTANRYLKGVMKECSVCKSTKLLVKHHEDYSKPLEVIILCRGCHNRLHKAEGDEK